MPVFFSSTASTIATRAPSTPLTIRRGFGRRRLDRERLHLDRQRAPPFERDRDARAGLGTAVAEEQRAGVGDLGDARSGHVEASDLVGRTEAVLQRADEPQRRLPVALELAHHVDEVLEDARTRDRPVLGDVADDDDGQPALLRDADEGGCDLAHLARVPGHPLRQRGRDGLHRIDDQQLGFHLVDVPEDRREVGLGGEIQLVVQRAGALGAQPHLRGRLLGARVQHASAGSGARRGHLEQQGRLADPWLTRQQDRRAGHDAAAEHAVELADSGGASRGVARVDRGDRSGGAVGAGSDRGRPSD